MMLGGVGGGGGFSDGCKGESEEKKESLPDSQNGIKRTLVVHAPTRHDRGKIAI